MSKNIPVPDIGDFKDVEIIEVLVKPGDKIKKNDPVVTLESDKSSVEVPSPFEGKISELKVKIGDRVSEGSILATLEGGEEEKEKTPEPKEAVKKAAKKEEKSNGLRNGKQKIYAQPISKDDIDPAETQEWLDSLKAVVKSLNKSFTLEYLCGWTMTITFPVVISLAVEITDLISIG